MLVVEVVLVELSSKTALITALTALSAATAKAAVSVPTRILIPPVVPVEPKNSDPVDEKLPAAGIGDGRTPGAPRRSVSVP